MGENANVWRPGTTVDINANSRSVEETILAEAGQQTFSISDFTYALGSGSLRVYKNGLLQPHTLAWEEVDENSFNIFAPSVVGDRITAVGDVSIEGLFTAVLTGTSYKLIGDFSDAVLPEVVTRFDVMTSIAVAGHAASLWRYSGALPYTPTGTDPTIAPELGLWELVSSTELQSLARAFNVRDFEIVYDNSPVILDGIQYIHVSEDQITYAVPSTVVAGDTITSILGTVLTTPSGEHILRKAYVVNEKGTDTNPTDPNPPNGTVLEPFVPWLVQSNEGAKTRPLPDSAADGDEVTVRDDKGSCSTNTITIERNGSTIMGLDTDATITVDWSWVRFRYYSDTNDWRIVAGGVGAQVKIIDADILNAIYGVGDALITRNANNPASRLGGVWVRASEGLPIAGIGISTDMNGLDKTVAYGTNAGEWAHTQIPSEVAEHAHPAENQEGPYQVETGGEWLMHNAAGNTGSNQAQATVTAMNVATPLDGWYIWERIA